MVDWEVTATTIYCDAVGDEVTLMVYKDWSTKCAWYYRYKQKAIKKKKKYDKAIRLKIDKCVGPDCPLAVEYRDKLIKEESDIT